MKLFFKVLLRDYQDKIFEKIELGVEFFNIETKVWEKIDIQKIIEKEGTYTFEYEVPSRIYGDQPTLRAIREVLQAGGMPFFRLIHPNSSKQVYILADQGAYTIVKEDILCDFKRLYLLEKNNIENLDNPEIPSVVIATSAQTNNIDPEVDILKKEIATLTEQLEKLDSNGDTSSDINEAFAKIEALNKTIASLEEQLAASIQENKDLKAIIEHQEAQLESNINNPENADYTMLIEILQSEKKELNGQLEEVTLQKSDLEIALNDCFDNIQSLESQLTANNEIINTLNAEKIALEDTIAQEVVIVNNQMAAINNYKHKEQQQQNTIEALEVEKETLKNQVDELSEEKIDQEYIPKSVSANKLYTDVIDEIQIAKENTASSGFKLSNISINLKTVAEKDEQGLRFQVIDINNASAINGAAISDIKIDITEDETSITSNDLIVPKLIGLTETAARKYLDRFNLRLDPVYQFINIGSSTISEGQAFRQSPEPGEVITPDSTVTVIFAKNNQYLN